MATPDILTSEILGSAAPPAALFAMGLFMVKKSFRGDRAEIALLTGLKLILHPLLAFGMLMLIPLEKTWADSLLVLAALPTGSLVFVLSNLYGVYTQRSTGVIIASTFAGPLARPASFRASSKQRRSS